MQLISKKLQCVLTASLFFFAASDSRADIVLSTTRIIYPESQKNTLVQLMNKGNKPLLAQIWLDDGRENTNPESLKVPFVLTPPVARIDPGRGQTVRITYMNKVLPADRESLYWFNVLEIPPKDKNAADQNQLQLAFRTRVKLLYRPKGIKGDAAKAAQQLKWHVVSSAKGVAIEAKNDSPYFVSLNVVQLNAGGSQYPVEPKTVPPFSSEQMNVSGLQKNVEHAKVNYKAINDFGGEIEVESSTQ
ncbi:fimbrial chaperone [Hafnia alvei]|uniref:Fimbrial chaperone n=1 Tax=Hafnia alvei TaxID=569 RepID=A0ABD7Q7D8_HAFAL|nr:fimbrial chaperone [Hafnia alvei]TBL69650.1 fimbrial chaperone [Hafnia alvei]